MAKKNKLVKLLFILAIIVIAVVFAGGILFKIITASSSGKPRNDIHNKVKVGKESENNSSGEVDNEIKIPDPPAISNPFKGKKSVTLKELNNALKTQFEKLAKSRHLKGEFEEFTQKFSLPSSQKFYIDFVKVKTIFECTRDCGLWHIQWEITNKEPRSDDIWKQWKNIKGSDFNQKETAFAECDEISALYSFLCRKNGVENNGLFWPTGNHTVAVWKLKSKDGKEVRVVVPTTQIFLENKGLFGNKKFDPWKQKAIYNYTRDDVGDNFTIPGELAGFFVAQVQKYGGASEEVLMYLRNVRESVFLGYMKRKEAASEVREVRDGILEDIKRQIKEDPGKEVSFEDIYAIDYFLKDFLKQ